MPVRNKLRLLYGLQQIDNELDDIHELRGDLPETVNQIQTKVDELTGKISVLEDFLKHGSVEKQRKEKETLELLENIDRYKGQQLKVRSNKEYDALSKEIDLANNTIQTYENEIESFTSEVQSKKDETEELNAQKEILEAELKDKLKELNEIMSSTEKEETDLQNQRTKVLKLTPEDDLVTYNRIRGAKRGKAVVPIKRGSCSGCYNIVPPQMILQIKKNDKVYLCEHCGRILISEELSLDKSPLL